MEFLNFLLSRSYWLDGFGLLRGITLASTNLKDFRGGLLLIHSMQYREALQQRRQEAVATAAIEALTKDSILHRRDVKVKSGYIIFTIYFRHS